MIQEPQALKALLSRTFSEAIDVRVVPSGLAIRAPFSDSSGDPLSFYLRETPDGFAFEDDGFYLAHLVASGVDIERGQRRQLLDSVLAVSDAYWDTETYEIRSRPAPDAGRAGIQFLSALMRIRDIELLTKEVIRSTFREDAAEAIAGALGDAFAIEHNSPVLPELADNPADIVLIPKISGKRTGVFLVNGPTPFVEAELLHSELGRLDALGKFGVTALIESTDKLHTIGMHRYQRAVNRGLPTSFFRGDEAASMSAIARAAGAPILHRLAT